MLRTCQSKGAQGTGRGCTNRSGSRWGAGRLQVDSRRRDVESGCRRQQIEDNARGRGRRLGGLLCFCKRGGHTLGGRACPRRRAVTGVPPSESEVQGHRGEEVCRWARLPRRVDVRSEVSGPLSRVMVCRGRGAENGTGADNGVASARVPEIDAAKRRFPVQSAGALERRLRMTRPTDPPRRQLCSEAGRRAWWAGPQRGARPLRA